MAPPVNKPGQPPDVTVHLDSKETDVIPVQRGSVVIIVNNVLNVSRETVARNVTLVSKVTNARNVRRTTTGMTAVIIFNCFYYDIP